MILSKLHVKFSDEEIRRLIYSKTKPLDDVCINAVNFNKDTSLNGEYVLCINGKYHLMGKWIEWTAKMRAKKNSYSNSVGLRLYNLTVKPKFVSLGLSLVSGMSSREKWVVKNVVSKFRQFPFITACDATAQISLNMVAEKYGVQSVGVVHAFKITHDGILMEIQ